MYRLTHTDERGRPCTLLSSGNVLFIERIVDEERMPKTILSPGFVARGNVIDELAEYENTGLTPEEIKFLKYDNERLHKLVDEMEESLIEK